MRYVGRHRAPRPLYLRRPVVGGVAVALFLGGPALAYGTGSFGKTGNEGALPPAATNSSAATVVPTDDTVVPTTDPDPTAPTTAPSTGTVVETTVDSNGHVTTTTRTTTHSTKPTKTTTKPTKTTKPSEQYEPVELTALVFPDGKVDVKYAGGASATGGKGDITITITGNTPAGLTATGGALTGTPTAAGTYTFTVTATDGRSDDSASVTVKIAEADPVEPANPAG